MALEPGRMLGSYQVTALIGEGGMGQVYQATDTKLNRQVALKILPEAFAADPDRLARFQREAQVLASLNHPNIAAIHGIEESDHTRALVLELVEGPTLADRIAQGPIPVDEALPIAKQIAEALEAAHEAGVIHRDLKPANIKVKDDGTVKVLDFGLAKALDTTPQGDPSLSPTLTAAATQMGVIMGTAAYMSPEQARGKPTDRRADIWSFGVALFEMLTGQRAFAGEDVSVTLADVIRADLSWEKLPSDLPPTLATYLRRCLEKDPSQRIRDIGDVRLAMEGASDVETPPPREVMPYQPRLWQRPIPVSFAAVVLAAVAGLAIWSQIGPAALSLTRFVIPLEVGSRLPTNPGYALAFSPDGQQLVYAADADGLQQLYLRSVDQLRAVPLRGTEGGQNVFWSPNGEWVGFQAEGMLKKIAVAGGTAETVAPHSALPGGASWGADDFIVFGNAPNSPLLRVSAQGGEPEALTSIDSDQGEVGHHHPQILPGGRAVLFTAWHGFGETSRVGLKQLGTDGHRILFPGASAVYIPTGHIVFERNGSLWAVSFDLDSLQATGTPVPVLDDVWRTAGNTAHFTVSVDGSLVYAQSIVAETESMLVWVDREGNEEPVTPPYDRFVYPTLSPDGTRIAVLRGGAPGSVWIWDLERANLAGRVTEGVSNYPVWSPDGMTLALGLGSLFDIHTIPADGSGAAEPLVMSDDISIPGSWSPDGQELLYYEVSSGQTGRDIWKATVGGGAEQILATSADESAPRLSPDGQWLAYVSDQSGIRRVYVQAYPPGGEVIPISTGQGTEPIWSRDGRELFYRDADQMLSVQVTIDSGFTAAPPQVLFTGSYARDASQGGIPNYDVSQDGQRFLMVRNTGGAPSALVVVQNWLEELKRLVPGD